MRSLFSFLVIAAVTASFGQGTIDYGRTFDPASAGEVNVEAKVPKPRIITKAEWGGGPSSGTLKSHTPKRLTLHHGGEKFPPGKDPKKTLVALQKYGWTQKNWADIPYHYVIDLDGSIYEARDVTKVGDTNTSYDPSGHLLVCVFGNYEEQIPNQKQLDAISDLYAWLADTFNVSPETLQSHKDYAQTACPGKNLYPYSKNGYFKQEIAKRLRKAYGKGQ